MSDKAKLTSRKLMELAIEVMRQSVPEPRNDGKAGPKVGAVLVKPDGTVETACWGEFRHGDHVESSRTWDGRIEMTSFADATRGLRSGEEVTSVRQMRLLHTVLCKRRSKRTTV